MAKTYIAWNGDEYPWPPPTEWYQAADGRWWAPHTGPGAGGQQPPSQPFGQPSTNLNYAPPSQPFGQPSTNLNYAPPNQQPPNQPFGQPSTNLNYAPPNQTFGQPGSQKSSSALPWILASLVIALLLITGGVAGLLLARGGDEPVASNAAPSISEPTIGAPTTTTVEPTTTSVQSATATVDVEQARQEYADYLSSLGIGGIPEGTALDRQAQTHCQQAVATSTRQDWDTYVNTYMEEFQSRQAEDPPVEGEPLNVDMIEGLINGAVVNYCPDQANRLSVTI